MNSKDQDLTQFEHLITELENPEIRPYAPDLPLDTKIQLRQRLLAQHDSKGLSRQAVGNLWKFAGTTVAAFLFIFTLVGIIAVLSNPSTQVSAPQNVASPPTRTPMTTNESTTAELSTFPAGLSSYAELNDLSQEAVAIGNRIQLLSYEMQPTAEGYTFQSRWRPLAILDEKFHLFVHLLDAEGNLVFQFDGPISEEPIMATEAQTEVMWELPIPTQDLNAGIYDIKLGFYNAETGERLPVSALNPQFVTDNETAVLLTSGAVLLEDDIVAGDKQEEGDRLWLISAIQQERPSESSLVNIEAVIGYQLESQPEAWLNLGYVSPDWQGENAAISMAPAEPIRKGTGTVTFTFSGDPTEMKNRMQSEQLILYSTLTHKVETNNGTQNQTILSEKLIDGYLDLTQTNEIKYIANDKPMAVNESVGQVELISVTQKERPSANAPIEIEYTIAYEYESDEDVFIKMSYGDVNWESMKGNGRLPIDGLDNPIFLNEKQGELTLTATLNPQEAKRIVETDTPVLIAELAYITESDEAQGDIITFLDHKTFSQFQLDLTSTATQSFSIFDSCFAIVTGTNEQGLVLRDKPNGEIITVLDESTRTELITTEPVQTINSLSWRKVHVVATDDIGWVMDLYLTYEPSPSTAQNACPAEETKSNDILEIISITPESGATLSGTTIFEIELAYTLTSLPEAEVMVSMFPATSGPANMSAATQTVSQGEGTVTLTFDFVPAETDVASDWLVVIQLLPTGYNNLGDAIQNVLATVTAHEDPDADTYHYRP